MAGKTYPWREGNRYQLTINGEHFFPQLLEVLDQARDSIDIEMYLVTSGQVTARLIKVLAAAVERGVGVRCLFDAVAAASLPIASASNWGRRALSYAFTNPLHWRGGSRNFHRDHRKIVVVDRQKVMVGAWV